MFRCGPFLKSNKRKKFTIGPESFYKNNQVVYVLFKYAYSYY